MSLRSNLGMSTALTTDVLAASVSFRVELERSRRRLDIILGRTTAMSNRTTQTVVRFLSAFSLPGFDTPQPPGEYRVEHDEESIEVDSRIAWRRVATFIHLPAIAARGSMQQMVAIDPAYLEAALEQDQKQL
jgi:hypothetical protein